MRLILSRLLPHSSLLTVFTVRIDADDDSSPFTIPVKSVSARCSPEFFKDDRQEAPQPFHWHRWYIIHSKWKASTSAPSSWRSITDHDDLQ